MKRVQALLLLIIVLALSACGVSQTPPQAGSTSAQETASESEPSTEQIENDDSSLQDAGENKDDALMNMTIEGIPVEYRSVAEHAGEVVRFDYDTGAEDKYAYVYVPYGYDKTRQYDILYMMHGGGGSQESLFGGAGQSNDIKNTIDHLIENGEMEPILIVTPTFYTRVNGSTDVSGSWDGVLEFPGELTEYLMPAVESAYSTYTETADETGFVASRAHRAFGGFSMGSVTTWYVFEQDLRYFSKFIPISGDSWTKGMQAGRSDPEGTAKALADSVIAQGYTADDFMIYAITGSEDIAEPCMTPMFGSIEGHSDVFRMSENANTYYFVKDGGVHNMTYVKQYLFNLLPVLYGGN
jgi:enterochelin esterase-like enzyme